MTQPIEGAITAIAAVVSTVTGVVGAPTYPPDNITYSPFALTYVANAHLDAGPIGTRRDFLSISIDLLVPMRKLDQDMEVLEPLIDPMLTALIGEVSGTGGRFSGSISTFESVELSFIPNVDYAGIPMRGYRFMMNKVKILVNL